jgi:hypothetical protein
VGGLSYFFGDSPVGVTMGKMLKTSADNRKCIFPNCTHILSIYNHDEYCHVHQGEVHQGYVHQGYVHHEPKPEILTHRKIGA